MPSFSEKVVLYRHGSRFFHEEEHFTEGEEKRPEPVLLFFPSLRFVCFAPSEERQSPSSSRLICGFKEPPLSLLLLLLQSTRRPKFRQEKAGCRNLRLWWKGPRASAVSCHFNIRHGPLLELKERWKDNSSPRTSFFPYDICRKKGGRPAI